MKNYQNEKDLSKEQLSFFETMQLTRNIEQIETQRRLERGEASDTEVILFCIKAIFWVVLMVVIYVTTR